MNWCHAIMRKSAILQSPKKSVTPDDRQTPTKERLLFHQVPTRKTISISQLIGGDVWGNATILLWNQIRRKIERYVSTRNEGRSRFLTEPGTISTQHTKRYLGDQYGADQTKNSLGLKPEIPSWKRAVLSRLSHATSIFFGPLSQNDGNLSLDLHGERLCSFECKE